MKYLLLIILASYGCCSSNKTTTNQDPNAPEVRSMTIKKSFKKTTEEQILFRVNGIKQLDNTIAVDVEYSGCGGEHDFELISNGSVSKDGIVKLYLVDNTKNDNCKMMIMKTKHFDIAKHNKSKVKGFKLNDSETITFKRTKK